MLVGVSGFAFVSYRSFYNELVRQVIKDNQVIGAGVLEVLKKTGPDGGTEKETAAELQHIIEKLKLPNHGYLCAASRDGDIVALPGLKEGQKMNINNAVLSNIDKGGKVLFGDLKEGNEFGGIVQFPAMGNIDESELTDIIAILPVRDTGIRLLVHQKREAVREKAGQYIKPMVITGLIAAFLLSAFAYIVVNLVVMRYENRLELINKELARSNEELAAVGNERKQLIHVLSHDLSNPLSTILGAVGLIDEDPVEFKKHKDLVAAGTKQAVGILELVKKMQALESGKMVLELKPVNLKGIIDVSGKILERKIFAKKIRLKTTVPADIFVIAEIYSFSNSVLNNLITNAVKFSPKTSTIEISAMREGETVTLTVRDRGIGMPDEIKKNIFNVSYKTNRRGTDGETGTGFGMPLVKKFVEAYGGSITIDSTEKTTAADGDDNHGTVVTVRMKAASNPARGSG
jgi:signal transduction histidine kinase